ncbi:hypothetical protein [Brasilonema sp. UFV-L1]|uniref:hypothetical protein n=2 Tax=Brasilonema sp. UFV-L1 TaxID=2234130 RepID=UPI001B7CF491|nr:hypothetical protein [Brasilonema sp. UFV-L1]
MPKTFLLLLYYALANLLEETIYYNSMFLIMDEIDIPYPFSKAEELWGVGVAPGVQTSSLWAIYTSGMLPLKQRSEHYKYSNSYKY